MNQTKTYKTPDGFSLSAVVDMLCAKYTSSGYYVSVTPVGNAVEIKLTKNIGGLWILTGMGEQLTVTLAYDAENRVLTSMISEPYYTDKIVSFVVGWFCLQLLWIFAAVGLYRQIRLPDDVDANISRFLMGLK